MCILPFAMPLLTPDYNNYIKRAWTYRASLLKQIEEGERPTSTPVNEHPYGEDTKVVDRLRLRGVFLSEAEQASAEKMYREGMSMTAIAKFYGCHYTTIGRILRRRNVPIQEKP